MRSAVVFLMAVLVVASLPGLGHAEPFKGLEAIIDASPDWSSPPKPDDIGDTTWRIRTYPQGADAGI